MRKANAGNGFLPAHSTLWNSVTCRFPAMALRYIIHSMPAPGETVHSTRTPSCREGPVASLHSPPLVTCIGLVSVPMALSARLPRPACSNPLRKSAAIFLLAIRRFRLAALVSGGTCIALAGTAPSRVSLFLLLVWALAAGTTASSVAAAARAVNDRSIGRIIRGPSSWRQATDELDAFACMNLHNAY